MLAQDEKTALREQSKGTYCASLACGHDRCEAVRSAMLRLVEAFQNETGLALERTEMHVISHYAEFGAWLYDPVVPPENLRYRIMVLKDGWVYDRQVLQAQHMSISSYVRDMLDAGYGLDIECVTDEELTG